MNQQGTLEQTSRSYPVQKRLSWWRDWEATNDLLLHPNRPELQNVTVTAALHPETLDTVVEIQCQIRNLSDRGLQNVQLHAVIVDEFGIIMTRSTERLWTRVDNLDAHTVQNACLAWYHECPDQNYHLMLRLEDTDGELLDVASGDFVLG